MATGTTAWSIAAVPLGAGTTVLTVTARDAANNTASATLTVTYNSAAGRGDAAGADRDDRHRDAELQLDGGERRDRVSALGQRREPGAKINVTYPAAAAGCGAGTGTCTVSPGVTLAPGAAMWWIRTSNAAGGHLERRHRLYGAGGGGHHGADGRGDDADQHGYVYGDERDARGQRHGRVTTSG